MKVGELVNFVSGFWETRVVSPGLVLEAIKTQPVRNVVTERYVVLWADGETTTEHVGFLERVGDEDR
jgi:hypothetical protein